MKGLTIDFETADRITLACLKDQLEYLRKDVKWYEADGEKKAKLEKKWGYKPYVHPEDYATNKAKLIPALELLIPYYGGEI